MKRNLFFLRSLFVVAVRSRKIFALPFPDPKAEIEELLVVNDRAVISFA
jgi:hypothetical protein